MGYNLSKYLISLQQRCLSFALCPKRKRPALGKNIFEGESRIACYSQGDEGL